MVPEAIPKARHLKRQTGEGIRTLGGGPCLLGTCPWALAHPLFPRKSHTR